MKYYNELSNLETQLIRFDMLSSLVNTITSSLENGSSVSDVLNTLYILEEFTEQINHSTRNEFNALWDAVRNDSPVLDEEYDFQPLDNVVKEWVKA